MHKYFILDTNVLLYDPWSFTRFGTNTVIIPIEVVEELGSFNRDMSELGQNARKVAQLLDDCRSAGRLGEGVKLESGGLLRIYGGECEDYLQKFGLKLKSQTERRILNLAVHLNQGESEEPAIIISKSINLRLKADSLGIYAEDYEEERNGDGTIYCGFQECTVPAETITELEANGTSTIDDIELRPNEYVLLRSENGDGAKAIGRADTGGGDTFSAIADLDGDILGIRPLNLGQTLALDALLNDDIKLVTLLGKAGTGKTLIAVAAGLHKVLVEEQYNRLLVSRPTLPMGRDIGYLPGEIEDKMRPWMQPIYDAIEMLRERDRHSRKRVIPADILESDDIGIEPLTYIRGRSIPHQFMIIDEAQNLSPLEVKTIITRVGFNTKIVLTGDLDQIDTPYIDARSSGFAYLIKRFRDHPLAASVTLLKGERSDLAEAAAHLL